MINDALGKMGGSVVSIDALYSICQPKPQEGTKQGWPAISEGRTLFPLDSSIDYIFSSKKLHDLAFPLVGGVLHWGQGKLECFIFV